MTTKSIQEELSESVDLIKAFFKKGVIDDKISDAQTLIEENHAMFFDGEVAWGILLDEYDRELKGKSEDMVACIQDIKANLISLADDFGADTEVTLFINT